MKGIVFLTAVCLGVVGFASRATAALGLETGPVIGQPASALVYPLFDSTAGHGTLITVTNTNDSRIVCDNDYRQGDICLLYTYFGFDTTRQFCREFNTLHCLTPGDTLTVIADQDNPEGRLGWLWVEARDPETLQAIDYDYLIGSAIVVDTGLNFLDQYLPYGFRSPAGELSGVFPTDRCGRVFTDLDVDGAADFNGLEYDFWPGRLLLDEFFQEGGTSPNFTNTLTLASCDVNPLDENDTQVSVGIWNNNETRFSASFDFECFFNAPLDTISQIVRGLRGDPNELVSGTRSVQAGWIEIEGSDPILGVFFQRLVNTSFAAGRELQFDGVFYPWCQLQRVD